MGKFNIELRDGGSMLDPPLADTFADILPPDVLEAIGMEYPATSWQRKLYSDCANSLRKRGY